MRLWPKHRSLMPPARTSVGLPPTAGSSGATLTSSTSRGPPIPSGSCARPTTGGEQRRQQQGRASRNHDQAGADQQGHLPKHDWPYLTRWQPAGGGSAGVENSADRFEGVDMAYRPLQPRGHGVDADMRDATVTPLGGPFAGLVDTLSDPDPHIQSEALDVAAGLDHVAAHRLQRGAWIRLGGKVHHPAVGKTRRSALGRLDGASHPDRDLTPGHGIDAGVGDDVEVAGELDHRFSP